MLAPSTAAHFTDEETEVQGNKINKLFLDNLSPELVNRHTVTLTSLLLERVKEAGSQVSEWVENDRQEHRPEIQFSFNGRLKWNAQTEENPTDTERDTEKYSTQALHFIDKERKHERICPKASRQSEQDAETTLPSTPRVGIGKLLQKRSQMTIYQQQVLWRADFVSTGDPRQGKR